MLGLSYPNNKELNTHYLRGPFTSLMDCTARR